MALKRIGYRRIRFPKKPRRSNIAVQTFTPPAANIMATERQKFRRVFSRVFGRVN